MDEPASHAEYLLIMTNTWFLLFTPAAFGFLYATLINEVRLALCVTIDAAGFGGGGVNGKSSPEGTFLANPIFTARVAGRAIAGNPIL